MFDEFGRPDWETHFMTQALVNAQRSIDPETKHGCVVSSQDKTVLSMGYNGPPRNSLDFKVPLTRPDKYPWLVHSEEAAIANAARHGASLKDSVFYVTGRPCEKCLRLIINVGASKVVYGNVQSKCVSEQSELISNRMLDTQSLEMCGCRTTKNDILALIEKLKSYVEEKF